MPMTDDEAGDAAAIAAFNTNMQRIVAKAVAAEREACARYAESLADEQDDEGQAFFVALKIAAHIRARSNNSN